jgi:hypothetical protein
MSWSPKPFMSVGSHEVVAGIIRSIPEPETRKQMADYFATEFNRRSKSFDPAMWHQRTGGTPAPGSAA